MMTYLLNGNDKFILFMQNSFPQYVLGQNII